MCVMVGLHYTHPSSFSPSHSPHLFFTKRTAHVCAYSRHTYACRVYATRTYYPPYTYLFNSVCLCCVCVCCVCMCLVCVSQGLLWTRPCPTKPPPSVLQARSIKHVWVIWGDWCGSGDSYCPGCMRAVRVIRMPTTPDA